MIQACAASVSTPREVGVLLHERRDAAGGEAGPVGPDQQLAVGVRAGADADRRDRQLRGDPLGDLGRHHLQHDGERAGVLDGVRVGEQLLGALAAALDDVAAQLVLALRREPDVRHHRDAGRHDAADLLGAAHAALELDRVGAGLLHEAERGVQRLVGPGLVRAERHVGDDERALHGAGDGAGQRDEVVDRHRQRRVVAEHVVAGRVADEQEVDARPVEDRRR